MSFWWLLVPLSYFVGVFPTASLIARRVGHDPRSEGSGNPGASNVYRVAGKSAGALVLLGDILKGFIPAIIGLWLEGRGLGTACGLAATVGHIAPVNRGFRGGKGVATLGGTCWALNPIVATLLIAMWAVIIKVFRTASLGSLVIALLLPIAIALRGRETWEVLAMTAAMVIIIARHWSNIVRILRRTEHVLPG